MVEEKKQIVKSDSEAYGYNYASLADIAKQGFKIPVMETKVVEGELYMGWFDDAILDKAGEVLREAVWHQGAPVIVPEMKGMNAAQAMGSALTYARRYTAQMALGLACDDDSKLEKNKDAPEPTGKVYNKKVDFKQVREKLQTITEVKELTEYWDELHLSEKQKAILRSDFSARRVVLTGGGKDGVER